MQPNYMTKNALYLLSKTENVLNFLILFSNKFLMTDPLKKMWITVNCLLCQICAKTSERTSVTLGFQQNLFYIF